VLSAVRQEESAVREEDCCDLSAADSVKSIAGYGLLVATLLRSAWHSVTLRAAAVLGLGGLALAGSNLLLARALSPREFAQFALLYALVHVGLSTGPIGADMLLSRRLIVPDARLCFQTGATSLGVAVLLVAIAALLYPLSVGLLGTLLVSITAGGLQIAAVGYYRGRERIGFSLLLSSCANAALLLAALLALAPEMAVAILPAIVLAATLTVTAVVAWREIRAERRDWRSAHASFPWVLAWAAVSFIGAGILLTSLDRLVIPGLLGMRQLATFTILATLAGSPFAMLYQAVNYTLVPRLRNAADARQRRRALLRESTVVAMICALSGAAVLWLSPIILRSVLADRYAIGQPLLIAAICVGVLKVVASVTAAAVNALGSRSELIAMSSVGWLSIGVALLGAGFGARWGLIGVVYGIACGWLVRAVGGGFVAAPRLLRKSDAPGRAEGVAVAGHEHAN
jgi:O-antigen/teichoic acid export membrane protein